MNEEQTTTPVRKKSFAKGCGIAAAAVVGFIIIVSIIAGMASSPDLQKEAVRQGANAIKEATNGDDAIKILELKIAKKDFVQMAIGVAQNTSKESFGYAQISINVYDKKGGTLLGSTLANINNIEPGQKWKFEAPIMEEGAHYIEVKGIDAM